MYIQYKTQATYQLTSDKGKQMRTLSEAAKAAALIRKHLKKHNIKASVTSDNYSMGSSVDVTIKQDTLPAMVQDIKNYCAQYQYGHFDGMTD